MALLQVDFRSQTLKRSVIFNVFLPYEKFKAPYPTLYLLHGLKDNCNSWLSYTTIRRLAETKGFAVVMPSGENAFYLDVPVADGCYGDFGAYVAQELVEVTREMFPLSRKREETFLAGLSMGGFGACRNGLKYHDTFSKVAILSGALHFFENDWDWVKSEGNSIGEIHDFGDIEEARNSDKNPAYLIQQLAKKCEEDKVNYFPDFYICCGTEDHLIYANRSIAAKLKNAGANVTYRDGKGGHTWEFWEEFIHYVVDWLNVSTIKK